ncbi:unnamed protein product [Amoebophrya sp. A120]|nr:unnamed protein product [Amoebophrya sp. A120]|eukprot:GSA120T00006582001.1
MFRGFRRARTAGAPSGDTNAGRGSSDPPQQGAGSGSSRNNANAPEPRTDQGDGLGSWTFSCAEQVRTYHLDIQWNGSSQLKIHADVPRPFVSYKEVKIRIGSDNCRAMAGNKLVLKAVLPNQNVGEWEEQAGATGLGSVENMTLIFSNDGARVLESSSFQRQHEGALGVSGILVDAVTRGMRSDSTLDRTPQLQHALPLAGTQVHQGSTAPGQLPGPDPVQSVEHLTQQIEEHRDHVTALLQEHDRELAAMAEESQAQAEQLRDMTEQSRARRLGREPAEQQPSASSQLSPEELAEQRRAQFSQVQYPTVVKIRVWAGDLIDAIEFELSNGVVKRYPPNHVVHGNQGGGLQSPVVEMHPGESLVRIEQRSTGPTLDYVTFITSENRSFSFGNPNHGLPRNDLTAPVLENPDRFHAWFRATNIGAQLALERVVRRNGGLQANIFGLSREAGFCEPILDINPLPHRDVPGFLLEDAEQFQQLTRLGAASQTPADASQLAVSHLWQDATSIMPHDPESNQIRLRVRNAVRDAPLRAYNGMHDVYTINPESLEIEPNFELLHTSQRAAEEDYNSDSEIDPPLPDESSTSNSPGVVRRPGGTNRRRARAERAARRRRGQRPRGMVENFFANLFGRAFGGASRSTGAEDEDSDREFGYSSSYSDNSSDTSSVVSSADSGDSELNSRFLDLPNELPDEMQIRLMDMSSCPICFEDFSNDVEKCVTSECGHAYCRACALNICSMEAPRYTGKCAVCRKNFSLRNMFCVTTKKDGSSMALVRCFEQLALPDVESRTNRRDHRREPVDDAEYLSLELTDRATQVLRERERRAQGIASSDEESDLDFLIGRGDHSDSSEGGARRQGRRGSTSRRVSSTAPVNRAPGVLGTIQRLAVDTLGADSGGAAASEPQNSEQSPAARRATSSTAAPNQRYPRHPLQGHTSRTRRASTNANYEHVD